MSEVISKSPMSAYSELKNSSEEEEPEDFVLSMTMKNHWERSNPLIDWRELNWKQSHQKTERRQERKKEEKFKKSKSTNPKRKEEPKEDKTRTSKENKERRRNNLPVDYLNMQ